MFTTAEFADQIGVSARTVARWRRDKYFVPSEKFTSGRTTIWLYTKEDLERWRSGVWIKQGA